MAVVTIAFMLTIYSSHVAAQSQESKLDGKDIYVKIKVDGLACSFCAYGLEKKLKKYQNAKDIEVNLQEGLAIFRVPGDKKPDEKKLKELVADAGFTARELNFVSSDACLLEPGEFFNQNRYLFFHAK